MIGRNSLRARFKRFAAAREGAAAVEFALVVGPFLFMIFAVLELAVVSLLSSSLDTASERAARRIRTGEVQEASEGVAAFKTRLCEGMVWLSTSCTGAVVVDVRKFEQFADTNIPNPIKPCPPPATGQCFDENSMLFDAGGPTDVIVVRVYYKWPLLTPFLSNALAKLNGNVAVITSTQTFRNEPFA
ncbi:MAG TPA: TadE/TadG family type IV pilus assembly protein [Caulobacteraceae bacterium]|jgi:Flp pilus assembly protein TadG